MESLGIEGTEDETHLLQESISLKAFLRVNKDSRRDHLISTIESGTTPIQTPEKENAFKSSSVAPSIAEQRQTTASSSSSTSLMSQSITNTHNSHNKFSLSYTPTDDVMSSPRSPRSPLPSNDYFNDMSHDESKLPGPASVNQRSLSAHSDVDYFTDRDRSKVAENFNAMNTIINSTFKEKIDYQRKLREQQSELNVLKEKMQRLRQENSHLAKAITNNKQSSLPLTMASIYRRRRLAKLRRGLARWQDFARGSSLAYVHKMECEFQKREAEYVHSGRLLVMKLRMSAFRSLGIIHTRRRRELFRKAFSQWHITVSATAHRQQQKNQITSQCVMVMRKTRAQYRFFGAWRQVCTHQRALHSLVRKMGIYDHKRTLRSALATWRGGVRRGAQMRVLKTCTRTLLRHCPVAESFSIWKHRYCTLYYPRKVMVLKSIWRRCGRMRIHFLQASFARWCRYYKRDLVRQQRVWRMLNHLRKSVCRLALRKWNLSVANQKEKQRVLGKVFNNFAQQSLQMTKCMTFSRWQQHTLFVDREKHAEALLEREHQLLKASEEHSHACSNILANHARNTGTMLQCVKLLVTMMKLLACRQNRLHRLMIAFKRWSYLEVVTKSVHNTLVVHFSHRIVMLMFARMKQKRKKAFAKWKQVIKHYQTKRSVILRMLESHHKTNTLAAFLTWKQFCHDQHVQSLYSQMEKDRVTICIGHWMHVRIFKPFRKWKAITDFLTSRINVVSRVKKIITLYFLRLNFQKWHRATVVHDLLEQKSCLKKCQAVQWRNIQKSVIDAPAKCTARLLYRWKLFTKHARKINRAIQIRTKLTHQRVFKRVFVGWGYAFRIRKKYYRGVHILHTLTAGANSIRIVKYFNHWTRAVARHAHKDYNQALTTLQRQHHECEDALESSRSECHEVSTLVSQLTHANSVYQLTLQKEEEYKNSFVLHLSYKNQIHIFFSQWRERYFLFKRNQMLLQNSARHLFSRLDAYCVRQRFSLWKLKVNHRQLCLNMFSLLDYKWLRCQVQGAFRRWQQHSLQSCMAEMAENIRIKCSEMDNEVTFYQGVSSNVNMSIVFMNKWKDYVMQCVRRKKKLHQCVVSFAYCKVFIAFQKWKCDVHCVLTLLRATSKLSKAKICVGFSHWKRTHGRVKKLDGVMRHLHKWQQHTTRGLLRTWVAYRRVLHQQRRILRSILLTRDKRAQAKVQLAFIRWVTMFKTSRDIDHKAEYLTRRLHTRSLQGIFTEWHNQYEQKKTYRKTREQVVYSVSQSLPVVRDLYDVLFSADTVDSSVALSTLAVERILPGYTAEIYVMVSNTMLRASVPLKSSVHGTTSRFSSSSSHLFDTETRPSPMDIPSSPIYQQFRSDLTSPSASFLQSHVLPPSPSGQPTPSPWTTEKTSPVKEVYTGGHLYHTPYEQRVAPHEEASGSEIVSVIVGRGAVGLCAKTGIYQVNRQVSSTSHSPDRKQKQKQGLSFDQHSATVTSTHSSDDIVSIVIPLISSGCLVGVLQLTPHTHSRPSSIQTNNLNPNAPVPFPYPSASASASSLASSSTMSYPFPPPPPSQEAAHTIPSALSPTNLQTSRFLKTATTPLPPPQFSELVNMCIDIQISDINTVSQLCIVVGTLSDSLRMSINGNKQKTEYMSVALAEKEQLETYVSQLHGEVATFEESIEKASKRIEHLEKSRLKYFNECKTFKDKADSYEKNYEGLTETLNVYKEKLEKYEDKKHSESLVMEKLHHSLTKASLEVFGTPAASTGHPTDSHSAGAGGMKGEVGGGNGRGGSESYLHQSHSDYNANNYTTNTNNSSNNNQTPYHHNFQSTHLSSESALRLQHLEDPRFQGTSSDTIRINTHSPLASSHLGYPQPLNTLNTLTTYDTSSRFSPVPTPTHTSASVSAGVGMSTGPTASVRYQPPSLH